MSKQKLIPREAHAGPLTKKELQTWRATMRWTQKDAADWLRITLRSYENWEQGYRLRQHHPGTIRQLMNSALRDGKKGDHVRKRNTSQARKV